MNSYSRRLAPADTAWLEANFARNCARFGDLRMEAAEVPPPDDQQAVADQSGADEQSSKVGPNGYPENTPWRDMDPAQQVAYWQHKAKSHESGKKAALTELAAVKPKAERYDALDQAGQDEKDRQIAALNKQIEDANAARIQERTRHGAELVNARLSASAEKKGMTAEALLTLAGKPDRFFGDEGVDIEAIDDFLAALPDKAQGAPSPLARDLGGGPRASAHTTGVQAGVDLYASRHPKKITPA
jgi:hypothetical protein